MEFDWDAANVAHICTARNHVGETNAARLLTFVITERQDKIRFVTAHPMHAKQREIYQGEE